jgi:urea transport system ATP-binding protein
VLFKGQRHNAPQEHQIAQLGIGRKFQAPSVFASLSVADNLDIAARGERGVLALLRARLSREREERRNECWN